MRPKGSPQALEVRRRKAIALVKEGLSVTEVARQDRFFSLFSDSLETAGKGKRRICLKSPTSPSCRLSDKQKKRLAELLLQGATAFGYSSQLWTLPRIARLIEEQFGITYHPASVWKILHSLGWSCQRPQRYPRERKEEEIRIWRKKKWPHIKKLSKRT